MAPSTIVIPAEALDGSPDEATQALVDHVNQLREQLWASEEIPDLAWSLYYADYYLAQLANGGHSQFFYNARPWEEVARLADAGLRAVGADRQAQVLGEAVALVEAEPALLEQLVAGDYWDAAPEVAPRFERFDGALESISEGERWPELCQKWLREADQVERLGPAAYAARLDALAEAVPDRDERVRAAEEAREARMPQFEKEIRAACERRGLRFDRLTAGRPRSGSVLEWSFLASGVRRVAVVRQGELVRILWDPSNDNFWSGLLAKLGIATGL